MTATFRVHQKLLPAILGAAALTLLGALPAAATSLIDPADSGAAKLPERILAKSFRARAIDIDLTALTGALEPGSELRLDLFADLSITATTESVAATGPDSFTWKGRFDGDPASSAVLVVSDGLMAGGFTYGGRRFQIDPGGRDRHYVYEVDLDRLPADDADGIVPDPQALSRNARHTRRARLASTHSSDGSSERSVIDLAVFFTPKAKKAAGGKRALKTLIRLGVAETNAALENSMTEARFDLVKMRKIPYAETDHIPTDLDRLLYPGDGHLDKVHAFRDRYRADAVLLVVSPVDRDRCGAAFLAPLATNSAAWAFGVTRHDCISPAYSFGHELGHIMGLGHDHVYTTGPKPYLPYGLGYHEPSGLFRTMMATKLSGMGPRVLHFSNPTVLEQDAATGVDHTRADAADSARTINSVRHLLESFR